MNDGVLNYDQLIKLDDKYKYLIINLVSIDMYIDILKKQPNKYTHNTKGLRIDKSSHTLIERIPKIFLEQFNKGNTVVVDVVINNLKIILLEINEELSREEILLPLELEKPLLNNIEEKSFKIFESFKKVFSKDNTLEYIKLYIDIYKMKPNMEIMIELEKISIKESFSSKLDLELEKRFAGIEVKNDVEDEKELKLKRKIEKLEIDLESELFKNKDLNKEIKQLRIDLDIDHLKMNNIIKTSEKNKEEYYKNIEKKNEKIMELEEKNIKLETERNKNNDIIIKDINSAWVRNNEQKILEISENEEIIEKQEIRKQEFNNYLEDFLSNIDQKILDVLLKESVLKGHNILNFSKDQLNIKDNLSKKVEVFEIISEELKITTSEINYMEDFICDLDNNLNKYGVVSSNRQDDKLARYISSILLLEKMSFLICGYGGRDLATSLSMVYSSQTPHIIVLPNGYNNITNILDIIENSESEVILIENYQGGINDNLILNLVKKNMKKILLFSIEDIDLVKYIPKYMFNYLALINIDISFKEKELVEEEFSCSYGTDFLETYKIIENQKIKMKHRNILEMLDFSKSTIDKIELGLINYSAFIDMDKIEISDDAIENSLGEYLLEEYLYIENNKLTLKKLYRELSKNEYESEYIKRVLNKIVPRIEE